MLAGIRRSNAANTAIVSTTLLALTLFVVVGAITAGERGSAPWVPFFQPASGSPTTGLRHATALMFVAFTGYDRIATLGEEVHEPRRTIPRAIVFTLVLSAVIYIAVGAVGIATVGATDLAGATLTEVAPLVAAARTFAIPDVRWIVAIGAITAMLGVLLNLILGLSRMLLAMGRRRDMPGGLARIDRNGSPAAAIVVVGIAIGALALIGNVKMTWSFSAFTVLVYYAITNLAALRLPKEKRLYSPAFAWAGLATSTCLAFFVEREIWLLGLGLIAAGVIWHVVAQRVRRSF